MLECMEIIAIATQKGLHLHAVKGEWQLDGTMQSKIIAMAFSMAAEIERDLISQRTTEALRAKKAAGMKLGRPKGPGKSKLDTRFGRKSRRCWPMGPRRSLLLGVTRLPRLTCITG